MAAVGASEVVLVVVVVVVGVVGASEVVLAVVVVVVGVVGASEVVLAAAVVVLGFWLVAVLGVGVMVDIASDFAKRMRASRMLRASFRFFAL